MVDTECVLVRPSRKRAAEVEFDDIVETYQIHEVLPVTEEINRVTAIPGSKLQVSERRRYIRTLPAEQPMVVESL